DRLHGNLLLNLAILLKSQGEVVEASKLLARARNLYEQNAPADALGLAAFDAAEVNLLVAQTKFPEARDRAVRLQALCEKHEVKGGILLVTAGHARGLYHLQRREFKEADAAWAETRAIQEREKQRLLLPRTVFYQGYSRELQGDAKGAEALYFEALGMQKD